MRLSWLSLVLFSSICLACTTAQPRPVEPADCPELASLTPAGRAQVMALARVVESRPRFALDFSAVGMQALSVGHDTMVTFATDPATTKEDVIFFIPAKRLIRAGLDTSKFEAVPPAGAMESGKWYYSSGRQPEPRFNNNAIGVPVLMMAIDTATP